MEQEVRINKECSELLVKFGISKPGNRFTLTSVGRLNAAACAIGLIINMKFYKTDILHFVTQKHNCICVSSVSLRWLDRRNREHQLENFLLNFRDRRRSINNCCLLPNFPQIDATRHTQVKLYSSKLLLENNRHISERLCILSHFCSTFRKNQFISSTLC
jgi:hypothetical protein